MNGMRDKMRQLGLTLLGALLLSVTPGRAGDSLTNGLLLWYACNEGAGTNAIDRSGNGRNGNITAPTWNSEGLVFNGTNSHIDVPNNAAFELTDAVSITALIKRQEVGRRDHVLGKSTGSTCNFNLFIHTDNRLYFDFWVGSWRESFSTGTISDTNWHQVGVTYNRTNVVFYIDGVAAGSTAETTQMQGNNEEIQIGEQKISSPVFYLKGTLDDVRLYNRALTSNEVQLLYATRGDLLHYEFNEGAGTNTTDRSGNGFNGNIDGATWDTYGLSFDGVNDHIDVPSNTRFELTDAVSIAAIVKRQEVGRRDHVLGKSTGSTCNFNLFIHTDNRLYFDFWVGSWRESFSTGTISDTNWHQVGVTYNRTNVVFYIDGVAAGSTAETTQMQGNNEEIQIGEQKISSPVPYLKGTLDDVRLYNRALNASDMALLYSQMDIQPLTPSAPSGVTASDGTYTDRVRVTWNAVSGASGYLLFRNTSNSSNGLSVYTTTTDTTHDDTAVSVGVNYYYWVKATNSVGASAFSASDAGYASTVDAPTGLSASDGTYTDRVRVTWNAVSGASGYQLFRHSSDSSNSLSVVYATTTDTTYYDTSVAAGAIYWYWVKATNTAGASGFSVGDSGYAAVAAGAPSAPTNVVASDGAHTDKVRVSWDPVSDATSYEVWRNTSNDWASAGKIANTVAFTPPGLAEGVAAAAAGATYDDTAAAAGTVYYYWLKAKNSYGTSGFSTEDSGYVVAAGSLTPPASVVASDGTYTNKVRIVWSAVDGATAYEVWRGIINLSAFATKLGEAAGTLADDTDVIAETTYYYWVKAKTATETSAFSSSDSGFRANVSGIQPDVKINDADGTITLQKGADLEVAILLMTSSTIDADWWFIVATPGGWYYYDADANTWATFTDLASLHPSYQGPLFDFLAPVEIISVNTTWLLPGVYVIYFGVDTTMNGILDDTLYYDSSTLNLVE